MKQYLQSLLKEMELSSTSGKRMGDITITNHPYCTGSTTLTLHITSVISECEGSYKINAFSGMEQAG